MKYLLIAILLLGCSKQQEQQPVSQYFASTANADWDLINTQPVTNGINFRFVVLNIKNTSTAVLYQQGVATSISISTAGNGYQILDLKTPTNWHTPGYWGVKIDGTLYSLP